MKYLLPETKYYKANFHTHSTISDGHLTVEELKAGYKEKGYSILAVTDHEICLDHSDLNDEDFLFLTGYEMMTYDQNPRIHSQTYHINFIAKRPENVWQFYHPALRPYMAPYEGKLVCDGPEIRSYSAEQIRDQIKKAKEKGFLAIYNHPVWSLQTRADYELLEELWGVEIFNTGSFMDGFDDEMSQCYQELLKLGNCPGLVPVAADDAHIKAQIGGGWVMVGADKLEYGAVIEAMERGNVYASTGPEIRSLTLEGDRVRITCSEASHINFVTQGRLVSRVFPKENTFLTEATFNLSAWKQQTTEDWRDRAFFRIIVTDPHGKKAYTRAYTFADIEE